ncbi:hypothetical protein GCM10023197_07930 [Gordonia humi]
MNGLEHNDLLVDIGRYRQDRASSSAATRLGADLAGTGQDLAVPYKPTALVLSIMDLHEVDMTGVTVRIGPFWIEVSRAANTRRTRCRTTACSSTENTSTQTNPSTW